MLKNITFGGLELHYRCLKLSARFCPSLDRNAYSCCLTLLTFELALCDNKKVVGNFISFPESLVTLLLDSYNSSYD